LALIGFVFSVAKGAENFISPSITSTYIHLGGFKIGFVLHNFVLRIA